MSYKMKVCVFINLILRGIKQGNEDKLEVPGFLQKMKWTIASRVVRNIIVTDGST